MTNGLEKGILIPDARPFFTRIPHLELLSSLLSLRPEEPKSFFFKTGGPPYLRVWMNPPPHPTYLKVCIRHCPEYCFLSQSRICAQILANLASRVVVKSRIPLRGLESRKSFQTLKKRVVPNFSETFVTV